MISPASDYDLSSMKGIPSGNPSTGAYFSFSIHRLFEVFFPFFVGGIFFLAASLKGYSLFSEPVLGKLHLHASQFSKFLLGQLRQFSGLLRSYQDFPPRKSNWSCRYATNLADDPGCGVLTLTSLGNDSAICRSGGTRASPGRSLEGLPRGAEGTVAPEGKPRSVTHAHSKLGERVHPRHTI